MELIHLDRTDELYQEALNLRYDLFFRVPGLPQEIMFDDLESSSFHVAAVDNGLLCAYGRLSEESPRLFKISQMVVLPNMQGRGLGTRVLTKLIHEAFAKGAEEIYLNARLHAVSMYEKQGFEASGQTYVAKSTGVPHIKMTRRV
ncbi:GNAT family N-acetyltransferase [Vibrio scophthalmi]|uniref:GNAT family N-acetyltransferase n=1 Tax=Vibrio scophthalmi TaxID=45658 RepID=UPI0022849D0A|nr:GNAT family N-acetyltransferase [Vibrio scophthalmi]MCY9803448.1 GNAT family N-acetyltransferase [Vibrio scophthalmi]